MLENLLFLNRPRPRKCGAATVVAAVVGTAISSMAASAASKTNANNVTSTNALNYKMWNEQREYDYQKWKESNAYNTPEQQKQRYLDAGINPTLAMSNIGSGTVESTAGGQTSPTFQAPQLDVNSASQLGAPLQQIMQSLLDNSNLSLNDEKAQQLSLQNIMDTATLMDRIKSVKSLSFRDQKSAELLDRSFNAQLRLYNANAQNAELETQIKQLNIEGTQYDVACKKFFKENIQPLEFESAQQALNRTVVEIYNLKLQGRLTKEQIKSEIQNRANGLAFVAQGWYNAKTNRMNAVTASKVGDSQVAVNNQTAKQIGDTRYHTNYEWSKKKPFIAHLIHLGVDQMELNNESTALSSYDKRFNYDKPIWNMVSGLVTDGIMNDQFNPYTSNDSKYHSFKRFRY